MKSQIIKFIKTRISQTATRVMLIKMQIITPKTTIAIKITIKIPIKITSRITRKRMTKTLAKIITIKIKKQRTSNKVVQTQMIQNHPLNQKTNKKMNDQMTLHLTQYVFNQIVKFGVRGTTSIFQANTNMNQIFCK